MKNVFIAEMEDVIDKDIKVPHTSLSSKVRVNVLIS